MNDEKFEKMHNLIVLLNQKLEQIESQLLLLNPMTNNTDWIDEKSVKIWTGLGKSTLYNLRKIGKLTSSKLTDRKLFYRKSDFNKLLDNNEKL